VSPRGASCDRVARWTDLGLCHATSAHDSNGVNIARVAVMTRNRGGRSTYHHGDLANSLVGAAVELAREGGPQAIVLREAARRVGVSPTSAYRHFADHQDLIAAVKVRAQRALTKAMAAEPVPVEKDARAQALARLRALGRGYLRFAQAEPGLFRTAFDQDAPVADTSESFGLLTGALDGLAASGAMPAVRRPGAETPVWATVHGLAEMLIEGGPLSRLDEAERAAEIERTLDFVARGLISRR
jgi:AcrR family transcriptional regulator